MNLLCLALLASISDALVLNQQSSHKVSGLYNLHIPKCGGTSFDSDVRTYFPDFHHSEGCYDDHTSERMITMLRNPRTHVLSQYFHCRTSKYHSYGQKLIHASFPEWIESWYDHLTEMDRFKHQPFCCYRPNNLMTARFSCGNGISEKDAHFHPAPIPLLKEKIANLTFVGLLEAYSESLCLLRIRETGQFPDECDCETERVGHTVDKPIEVKHITNGVQKHNISDYSEDVLKKVDKLTSLDKVLYELGKARFLADVQEAEKRHHKRILCRSLDSTTHAHRYVDEYASEGTDGYEQGKSEGECRKWVAEAERAGFPLAPQ